MIHAWLSSSVLVSRPKGENGLGLSGFVLRPLLAIGVVVTGIAAVKAEVLFHPSLAFVLGQMTRGR